MNEGSTCQYKSSEKQNFYKKRKESKGRTLVYKFLWELGRRTKDRGQRTEVRGQRSGSRTEELGSGHANLLTLKNI